MSVLIKGMEMPKDCGHCQFKYINMSGYVICEMLHKQIVLEQFGARFDHCPLVEIPTPHGRLIDADALQLAIVEEGQANKRKKYIIGDIWELTWAEIREVINSQPTIQPEIVMCKDCKYSGTDATCCLVCNREGMGLRPFHVYHDDYCSYADKREVTE